MLGRLAIHPCAANSQQCWEKCAVELSCPVSGFYTSSELCNLNRIRYYIDSKTMKGKVLADLYQFTKFFIVNISYST